MEQDFALKQANEVLAAMAVREITETAHRAEVCGCAGCRGQAKKMQEYWLGEPPSPGESKRRRRGGES